MITTLFRPFRCTLLPTALLLCMSAQAMAETRYVTDILQLSLYEEINSKGKLLERLNSGTELELLETSGLYARVRTQQGVEGWTKLGFLITEKPARAQLADLQTENEALRQQLDARQKDLDATKEELARVTDNEGKAYAEMAQRLENAESTAADVARLQAENDSLRGQLSSDDALQIPVNWALIAAGVSLILGMIAGIALFDYRSRKRHGGYRIY